MSRTPLTPARRAALEFAAECDRLDRWAVLRNNPASLATFESIAPKRNPAWSDDVGRACCSLRDWLRHGHPEPMTATRAEIRRALGGTLT